MVSKTLVKLIDIALLPAILLAASKILAVIAINSIYRFSWSISSFSLVYSSKEDFVKANSYSSLVMFLVMCVGLIIVLVNAHFFHDTHIKPNLSTKIYSHKFKFLLQDTLSVYFNSLVWGSYIWLTTAMFAIQAYAGLTGFWLVYLSGSIAIVFTFLIVLDIERELVEEKKDPESIFKSPVSIYDLEKLIKV